MKLGVVSDSHGHTENVRALADCLLEKGVRRVFHLGDDAEVLLAAGLTVDRVPGVFSGYYQNPEVPNRLLVTAGGCRILLTHSEKPHPNDLPGDLAPETLAERERPDLVFFGHSHQPVIEDRDGIAWVNPGHLKPEDKKGAPPSYAVINTETRPVRIQILALEDDRVLMENLPGR